MASTKISNLPAASSVTGTSLIAVVNGNVTQKATVSQLPLGMTTVNNLGGGNELGTANGSELQLKTLISGTGIDLNNNSNTITLSTNLSVDTVGGATSLLYSFSNPNLSLKTITGSNGITINDNGDTINIQSLVDTTKDSIIGLIETATVKEYILELYINKPYTLDNLYIMTSSGTATVRLKSKNSSNTVVTTGSTFTATTTRSSNSINSFTTSIGQQLILEVVTNTAALNLSFTVDLTYN